MAIIIPKHSLEELIKISDTIITEAQYDLEKAKHPKKKRYIKNQCEFWTSINYHLKQKSKTTK